MRIRIIFFTIIYFILIKQSTKGQSWLWANTFNSKNECGEQPIELGGDNNGNVFLRGNNICSTGGTSNMVESNFLLRYSPVGLLTHTAALAPGYWFASVDNEGNTLAAIGNTIIKYNSGGQLVWSKVIPNRYFKNVCADDNGEIIVGGITRKNGSSTDSSAIYKLDSNGNVVWHRIGDLISCNKLTAATIDKNGDFYAIGYENLNNWWNGSLIKISNSGTLTTKFTVAAGGNSEINFIDVTSELAIYLGCQQSYYPKQYLEIKKCNQTGSVIWAKTIIAIGYPSDFSNIRHDYNNDIYVGVTFSDSLKYQGTILNTGKKLAILKFDSAGVLISESYTTGNPFSHSVSDIHVDKDKNVFVSGYLAGSMQFGAVNNITGDMFYGDMYIAKLSTPSLVASTNYNEKLNEIISLSPNPTNNIFTIECVDMEECYIEVYVFTTIGQKVYGRTEKHNGGTYSKIFDMNGLPKGVYFVEINVGSYKALKKVILM